MTQPSCILIKAFAIEVFATLRQAHMSIHRRGTLDETGWNEIKGYYEGAREQHLASVIGKLAHLCRCRVDHDRSTLRSEVREGLGADIIMIKPVSVILSRLFGRVRAYRFPVHEIEFISSCGRELIEYLERPGYPAVEVVWALEADLNLCSFVIERRCRFTPNLKTALYVEHYNQAATRRHDTIEELTAE